MQRKSEKKQTLEAEVAYGNARLTAHDLIKSISNAINGMPRPIHWGHVGDVVEVNRRLSELLGFLTGSER